MSLLLSRIQFPQTKGKKVPLLMEFPVSRDTAPYLVTSTKGMIWVEEPMDPTPELWPRGTPERVARVAVRPDKSGKVSAFFREVILSVEARGVEQEWGNVHDYTEAGIVAAIEHVAHYELGDLCLLFRPEPTPDDPPFKEIARKHELLPQPCSWLPENTAVVVPKDRDFVGSIGLLGRKGAVVIVHNAARGIGIASLRPRS